MADNSALIPLTFKPGIKRDGTRFDSESCIDGYWTRFYNGKPKTMGGMESGGSYFFPADDNCTSVLITPNPTDAGKIFAYFATKNYIKRVKFNLNPFTQEGMPVQLTPNITGKPNLMWQAITLIHPSNKKRYVAFLGTNSFADINDNSPPIFYYGLDEEATTAFDTLVIGDNLKLMNGGLCWASPYLFLYGSNGSIAYSKNNDPFDFSINASDPATGGSLSIGPGDKVIYGSPIRGGSASPSILFWTLSSVVRVSNIGDKEVAFKADTVARGTSILSSRCVVEYDGLFFWPGTDRFFVYNGVVERVRNNMNRNYFFDNLNLSYRQKVFSVKNPSFGEIWWVWPSYRFSKWSEILIFNNNENTWYDTSINERYAAFYYESLGKIFSTGRVTTSGTTNDNSYIWQHESGIGETVTLTPGAPKVTYLINSFFNTPYFSLASIGKAQGAGGGGTDRYVEISRIEPDFILKNATGINPSASVAINTIKYPQSKAEERDRRTFFSNTEKIDCRSQGRYMNLTFRGDYLEMGNVMLLLSPGDGQ